MHTHTLTLSLQVGSYAFTTLTPQLGTVVGQKDDSAPDAHWGEGDRKEGSNSAASQSLILADIPGLIAGAHEDR